MISDTLRSEMCLLKFTHVIPHLRGRGSQKNYFSHGSQNRRTQQPQPKPQRAGPASEGNPSCFGERRAAFHLYGGPDEER